MQLLEGKILNNRYRIKERLGWGGFGAVYLAEEIESGDLCAIKENLDDSDNTVGNFLREASMLYNLRHKNLPVVWDHFVVPGEGQYLVMEYIEGISLSDLLEREGKPFPTKRVATWISQVCDALMYLHSQNPPIIHRDIKPGNIRLTPGGKAVLVDFGIAKFYDEQSQTSTVARAVSPGYSPLEQYGLGKTDARSDIYALGITTYKLLTTQMPPPSVDLAAGTAAQPKTVAEVNPKVSPSASSAIEKSMSLKVSNRTPSIAKFKEELIQNLARNAKFERVFRKIINISLWALLLILLMIIITAIWYIASP